MPIIGLVGTLDTKGGEYVWLHDRLLALGCEVVLIDTGVGEARVPADVGNERVALAAGADVTALRAAGDRGVPMGLVKWCSATA